MSQVEEKTTTTGTTDAPDSTRRSFLRTLFGTAGLAAVAATPAGRMLEDKTDISVYTIGRQTGAVPEIDTDADVITRMNGDLARALQKQPAERRWVMVIDLRKCVGCHACTIACVAENKLPPGVVYRPVLEEEWGTYPNVGRRFVPRPCMQCDNPPCVPVCPVGATFTNEEGIVEMNYERCIGCRYCITACPYSARTADFGFTYNDGLPIADGLIIGQTTADDYERISNFEYGRGYDRPEGERSSPIGNARKCHFCQHRIKEGVLPACVTTCIGRATYFGDANDSFALVTGLITSPNVMRLKEELGTEPRVYYLA
ncbi:MAG: 4Fe-4S dicluster domain-containing protein [Anaerolineae bacterium]|nr:4Fe-4S dicluster domain-containing protein [Anaerolineae bacterium]